MGKSEGEVVKPLINVCVKCGGMDVKSVGQSLGYCISCGSQIPFRIHPARIAAEGLVAKSEVAELVKALELNAADSCPSARLDCNQRYDLDANNVIVKTWWEHGPDCPKTAAIKALAHAREIAKGGK